MCVIFWVFPRCPIIVECRRFGTIYLFHLQRLDMKCEVLHTSYPAFEQMEQIKCSETSAFNNQMPGKYPKDYTRYSKHGESLKSRILFLVSLCEFRVTCSKRSQTFSDLWNKNELMSLFQFYSYIAGSLTCFGLTGPSSGEFTQLFTQPMVQYLYSSDRVLCTYRARDQSSTDTEPMVV